VSKDAARVQTSGLEIDETEGRRVQLLIASHKLLWTEESSSSGFATDGGFSVQVGAISELFDRVVLCTPVSAREPSGGLTPIPASIEVDALRDPEGTLLRRRFQILPWTWQLFRAIRRADAVHAPVPGDVGFLAILISLVLRKRLFVRHCGTWREPRTRADRLLRQVLERSAGGRVVVLATGDESEPPTTSRPQVHWIFSSSIRAEDLESAPRLATRTAPAPGTARLVTGGRLIPDKGADTAIEAFAELHEKGLAAHLDVVGDGPARRSLEERASALGVGDHVTFHGRLSRRDVLGVFDAADLLVYPTRSSEGFPKLVLEATSRGLPTVATAVSAIPAMIEHSGVVVEANRNAVVTGAQDLLSNPERYRHLQSGTAEDASRYTLEAWVEEIGRHLVDAWGPWPRAADRLAPAASTGVPRGGR